MTPSCKSVSLFAWAWIFAFLAGSQISPAQQSPTDLSGFTNDEIFDIKDDQPLAQNNKNLARLLYRVQNVSQKSISKFSGNNTAIQLNQIAEDPRSFRCYVFSFSGYAQSVSKQTNPDAEAEDLFRYFDLIRCKTADDLDFLVAVPDSGRPGRWPENKPFNEPIQFSGFFLANYDFHSENISNGHIGIDGLNSTSAPLFVANQIDWFPDRPSDVFEIKDSEIALSKFGVNIAKLDHVRKNVLGKIDRNSAESFYQTLNAVALMTREDFPATTVDFKKCIQRPAEFQSAPMKLRGQIRRVTEVAVDHSSFANGRIDKYYQLDVFVPLEDHKIVFRTPDSSSENDSQIHENRFPVTVCVPELPLPKHEMKRKNVVISCFFFQRWNYESQQSSKRTSMPFQDAPLAIGMTPQLTGTADSPLNLWVGIFGILCLLGIGALYLIYGRTDSLNRSKNGSSQAELPSQIDISNLTD